ncbi:hypothetical protein [Salisediminibacterium halotolerans]|uniref:hypothetical protein n=1 Tax=Salisediminibacterium halotolerans TaxID=517425 RepID=UPI0012B680E7|nr:hypothetical protein [Salisediminibacterium halotolerans]
MTQHPGFFLRDSETDETLQGQARSGSALARGKKPDDAQSSVPFNMTSIDVMTLSTL